MKLPALLVLAGLLFFAPVLAEAKPVKARPDPLARLKRIELSYEVYLGGLHIMDSVATFSRKGPTYVIDMKAGTQGLLRSFAQWDADLQSTGELKAGHVKPRAGRVVTTWQNEPKTVSFAFTHKKGVAVKFDPPQGEDKHEAVPDALKADVYDPLSSIVQMMTSFAYGNGCAQTVPVYDGHRRFDLTLKDAGTEELEGDEYSIFSGTALRCEADFTMRAGTRKDREGSRFWDDASGQKTRPPVYIYLGHVREGLPILPVRAETSTVFGNIMVHLKNITAAELHAAAN